MKIVLVYVGKEAPAYVFKNLEYLQKAVGIDPVLITDKEKTKSRCIKLGITVWQAPVVREILGDIYDQMQHPKDFRAGFWFNTVARFGALAAFMESNQGECVLQVETDVWISPEFPFSKFENLKNEIAFGLETASTGSAALLFLRDVDAARKLLKIVRNEYMHNPVATDMTILGSIFSNQLMDMIVLPSIPNKYDTDYIYANAAIAHVISKNIELFGGIFDPLTIGLFITGEDPKNHRGVVRKFRNYPWHNFGINPELLRISQHELPLIDKTQGVPIFSIHNHAKEMSLFSTTKYKKYLKSQIKKSVEGPASSFKLQILISQAILSLIRRTRLHAKN